MKKTNVCIAGVMILVGLAAFIKALDYPMQSRMIPMIYSAALVLFSLIFAFRTLLAPAQTEQEQSTGEKEPLPKALLIMGIIFCYILSIQILGFYSSTAVFLFLFMGILRAAPLYVSAAISLIMPAIIYFFFQKMLYVPVPGGIFF